MEINDFFKELDKNNIKYYCWKGVSKISSFFKGTSDLDIYINTENIFSFDQILKKFDFINYYWPVNLSGVSHFYKVGENGSLFHLHVYYRMCTGSSLVKEYEILPTIDFFDNLDKVHGVNVLNRNLLLQLHNLRVFLKKKSLIGRLIYYKKQNIHNLESKLLFNKNAKSNNLPLNFKKNVNFVSFKNLYIYFTIKYRRYRGWSKISKNGIIASVIGPDGSGKSTTSNLFFDKYSNTVSISKLCFGRPDFHFNTSVFYIIRNLFIFLKRKQSIKYSKKSSEGNVSLLKACFYLMLAFERKFILNKAIKYRERGHIVLIDRCPPAQPGEFDGYHLYDYNGNSSIINKIKLIETSIYKKMPHVDIVFTIDVTEQEVLKRNKNREKLFKESDLEIIDRYNKFKTFKPKARVIRLLDGFLSPNYNTTEIIKNIFRIIS